MNEFNLMMPSRPTLSSETDIVDRVRYRQPEATTILALISQAACPPAHLIFLGARHNF
jgi:hypothetical protein